MKVYYITKQSVRKWREKWAKNIENIKKFHISGASLVETGELGSVAPDAISGHHLSPLPCRITKKKYA